MFRVGVKELGARGQGGVRGEGGGAAKLVPCTQVSGLRSGVMGRGLVLGAGVSRIQDDILTSRRHRATLAQPP